MKYYKIEWSNTYGINSYFYLEYQNNINDYELISLVSDCVEEVASDYEKYCISTIEHYQDCDDDWTPEEAFEEEQEEYYDNLEFKIIPVIEEEYWANM